MKLAPGVVAFGVIGGLGFYFGVKTKAAQVDRLQAQLTAYQTLGQRVTDLKAAIDASIQSKNDSLIQAYGREMEKVRTDFGQARIELANATDELKRRGLAMKTSAATLTSSIGKLPVGSPEREAKIADALAILSDENKLQQLCTATSIAEGQLVKLKTSFSLGAP